TLYRKRAVTWPFIFYTIIWTLSTKSKRKLILFVIELAFFTSFHNERTLILILRASNLRNINKNVTLWTIKKKDH
ncbi:hypothetical protein CUS29_13985, partial [Enterococcus faecium]